jgi:hypothetical protein
MPTPEDLQALRELADTASIEPTDHSREALEYHKRCRLIDHDKGLTVMLKRHHGRHKFAPGLHRWHALSVHHYEPRAYRRRDVNLQQVDQIARHLFGRHADHMIVCVDKSIRGVIHAKVYCDERGRPHAAPSHPRDWALWKHVVRKVES